MLESVTVNWGAIVIAGVVNMVLGALWYSPMLFGKMWMELMGVKEMKPNPVTMLYMFIVALATAYVFSYFIGWVAVDTFATGAELGLVAALGFVVLPMASGVFASGTSWKLFGINVGYWVVSLALMGGVLASMR